MNPMRKLPVGPASPSAAPPARIRCDQAEGDVHRHTLQTLGVMLAGAILGSRKGTLAVTVYVALGLVGLPILAGGAAGLGVLAGPTGGFLIGFIPGAFVTGWIVERFAPKIPFWALLVATLVGGVLVVYLVGIPWFAVGHRHADRRRDRRHEPRSSSAMSRRPWSPRAWPPACTAPGPA